MLPLACRGSPCVWRKRSQRVGVNTGGPTDLDVLVEGGGDEEGGAVVRELEHVDVLAVQVLPTQRSARVSDSIGSGLRPCQRHASLASAALAEAAL